MSKQTEKTSVRVEWKFDDNRQRVHVGCGGSVTLHNGRPKCHRCGAVDDNAGWQRRMLMWNWHWTSLDGWPGWDIVGTGHERHPSAVELSHVVGNGKQSIDIAREYDDEPGGLFYQRDFTSDNLPFVNKGETYRSIFWFERTADRDAFLQRYGGIAR